MAFTVRQAAESDIKALEKFQQKSTDYVRPFDPTLKKKGRIEYYKVSDLMKSKKVLLLIVEKDGKIVACGYGEIKDSPHFMEEKQFGYVGFMFVLEEFRRQGISKLILDELFQWFRKKKIKDVTLKTYSKNTYAIKSYEKYGFRPMVTAMHARIK
ncbi:MAG: GNAT family N-acetyltransferase [Candidatus Aenigmarchaeota archaeon]|nr:GNAT family N-acetyltransferase [Candidatus Aenigmarchaeota archaeon]